MGLQFPSVTMMRVSGDYFYDYYKFSRQWHPVGMTGFVTWALGMVPTKDNFWSTSAPQYHPYHNSTYQEVG